MAIAAVINTNNAPVEETLLRAVMGAPSRRCSPEASIKVDGSVGLGRLPLARGVEPGVHGSVDGHVWAVMEGRLDDRDALVSALVSEDGREDLRCASDGALIVRAYEAWGDDCASRLLGDFAFCLWDARNRHLLCARDHFGVKPLYFARVGSVLIVSSVLLGVRRHPAISPRLRDEAIGDLLLFGVSAEPSRTSFADVSRVPPAHRLTYSLTKDALRVNRYWTLAASELVRYADPREYVEQFSHLFRQAVADRVRSGPVGVLMSGGLDSSSVTATAADILGSAAHDHLRAFTFGYATLMPDEEKPYSSATATSLGIPISYMPADRYEPFERWEGEGLPPEPTLEALTAAMMDMLELVSGHGSVVLTGDGGDSSLLPSTVIEQVGAMPLASLVADLWHAWRSRRLPPFGIRSWITRRLGNAETIPGWLGSDLRSVFDAKARWHEVRSRRSLSGGARNRAVSDVIDPWWTSTFESLDPGATQRAVELRYPFFDVRLASFVLRLPSFPWCLNKHVLRAAMNGRLPESVRARPKTPLAASPVGPASQWSSARALALFESTPAVARFVDIRKFRATVRSNGLLAGETPAEWAAISLAMWLRGEAAMPALDGTR